MNLDQQNDPASQGKEAEDSKVPDPKSPAEVGSRQPLTSQESKQSPGGGVGDSVASQGGADKPATGLGTKKPLDFPPENIPEAELIQIYKSHSFIKALGRNLIILGIFYLFVFTVGFVFLGAIFLIFVIFMIPAIIVLLVLGVEGVFLSKFNLAKTSKARTHLIIIIITSILYIVFTFGGGILMLVALIDAIRAMSRLEKLQVILLNKPEYVTDQQAVLAQINSNDEIKRYKKNQLVKSVVIIVTIIIVIIGIPVLTGVFSS